MSLNPDLIRARCVEIDSSLVRLEKFRRLPGSNFFPAKMLSMLPAIDC
jgi:hypothetical protein